MLVPLYRRVSPRCDRGAASAAELLTQGAQRSHPKRDVEDIRSRNPTHYSVFVRPKTNRLLIGEIILLTDGFTLEELNRDIITL